MRETSGYGQGIRRLIEQYKKAFRLPENTQYYQGEDYNEAERKFVKYCLRGTSS